MVSRNNLRSLSSSKSRESADASSLKFFVCSAKKHNITDIKKQTSAGLLSTVAKYIFFTVLIST